MTTAQEVIQTPTIMETPTIDQVMDLIVGIPLTRDVLRHALADATASERRLNR